MSEPQGNRWKGMVTGTIGAVAGLLTMRYYWESVAPVLRERLSGEGSTDHYPDSLQLDDISLLGKQYRDDESSTDALGRIAFTYLTGSEPQSQETKTILSELVHWAYGLSQGSLYGALHSTSGFPDLGGGLSHGLLLWILGDELAVPLLGLQSGPTAVPLEQHANRLGAHIFYGAATAITTQFLRRVL